MLISGAAYSCNVPIVSNIIQSVFPKMTDKVEMFRNLNKYIFDLKTVHFIDYIVI